MPIEMPRLDISLDYINWELLREMLINATQSIEGEVQNEGRDENSECGRRRESDVGHGSTGTSGLSGEEVCETAPFRTYSGCDLTLTFRDARGEVARFRPEREEDCDDSPDVGRVGWSGWLQTAAVWNAGPIDFLPLNRHDNPAWKKAEALLLEHLDEGQAKTWKDDMSFDVIAPSGIVYKIDAQAQPVTDYAAGVWYCLQPNDYVPSPDVALAHKLWLESDEGEFLRTANCFPLRQRRIGQLYDLLTTNAPIVTRDECDIVFRGA